MPIPGYFTAAEYQKVLTYIQDGQYKKLPLDKYLGR
jgi:thioredoxin-related protein